MPTYEYECMKCGSSFEIFQQIQEEPLKNCPECRGKIKKLISSGAGFLFKGSGFYATDYRKSSYRKKADIENASCKKSPTCVDCPANKSS